MSEYYILCKCHMVRKDYAFLFWGHNRSGYNYNLKYAGRYSEEEIKKFSNNSRGDTPVLCSIVDSASIESVIDNRVLGRVIVNNKKNRDLLKIKIKELRGGETNWDYRAFCSTKKYLQINKNTLSIINQIKNSMQNNTKYECEKAPEQIKSKWKLMIYYCRKQGSSPINDMDWNKANMAYKKENKAKNTENNDKSDEINYIKNKAINRLMHITDNN